MKTTARTTPVLRAATALALALSLGGAAQAAKQHTASVSSSHVQHATAGATRGFEYGGSHASGGTTHGFEYGASHGRARSLEYGGAHASGGTTRGFEYGAKTRHPRKPG
jgi:hypothetical protein